MAGTAVREGMRSAQSSHKGKAWLETRGEETGPGFESTRSSPGGPHRDQTDTGRGHAFHCGQGRLSKSRLGFNKSNMTSFGKVWTYYCSG